eukprot:m.174543 g.174543  ORF g.174543 m.174543 type:complete len:279 (+) comp15322_c1_seq5:3322-4158(+)
MGKRKNKRRLAKEPIISSLNIGPLGTKPVNMDGFSLFLDPLGNPQRDANGVEMDRELLTRAKKVTQGFSESLYVLANEPSLGLYRLQEHIHKSVPELVEKKKELLGLSERIQGAVHDAEYAVGAVQRMHNIAHVERMKFHLSRAITTHRLMRAEKMKHQPGIITPAQIERAARDHGAVTPVMLHEDPLPAGPAHAGSAGDGLLHVPSDLSDLTSTPTPTTTAAAPSTSTSIPPDATAPADGPDSASLGAHGEAHADDGKKKKKKKSKKDDDFEAKQFD